VILRRGLALLLVAAAATSCAATTYDQSIAQDSAAPPTTTVVPTGTPAELLPRLVDEASHLSALIASGGDKQSAVDRLQALWSAVQAEVTRRDRDIATEIGAEIEKGRKAAQFNRPGSADKAYRNLSALVQAYLAGP
jgi:hypothetical protein